MTGMFSNTYWKRRNRALLGPAQPTTAPKEEVASLGCHPSTVPQKLFYQCHGTPQREGYRESFIINGEGYICRRDLHHTAGTGIGASSFMNLFLLAAMNSKQPGYLGRKIIES